MHVLGNKNWYVAYRSNESYKDIVLILGARYEDKCYLVANFVYCVNDLVDLEHNEFYDGVVVKD